MVLPRLYPILDASCFADANALYAAAEELVAAGVTLLQYRNKSGNAREMLEQARKLSRVVSHPNVGKNAPLGWGTHGSVRLIMNDRADLCIAADFDGLHIGQDDISPDAARAIIGNDSQGKPRLLGISTHNPDQIAQADQTDADYLAIGPVFGTMSKANPDPVVGLAGVHRARALTRKPLVAIGGITRANACSVIVAGADSVAVISDLLPDPRKSAEEFFEILG